MNSQEFFTAAVTHLRKQQAKSQLSSSKACCYRLPTDTRVLACGVGGTIPDDVWESIEAQVQAERGRSANQQAFDSLLKESTIAADFFKDVGILLGKAVQACHDTYPVHDWERRFKVIAKDFGLIILPKGQP